MRLHQLADQAGAKTIQLVEIAKASGFPRPHGSTVLSAEQQAQIAEVYRYMSVRKIAEPAAAITQMRADKAAFSDHSTLNGAIAIRIQPSIADELCRRYPEGSMSDRILKALGALTAFEQLHAAYTCQMLAATSSPASRAQISNSGLSA